MPTPVTTPRALGQAVVGSTPTPVYVASLDLQSVTIRNIQVCNNADTSASSYVWKLPDAAVDTVDDAYLLVPGLVLPAHGLLQDDGVHTLGPGGAIWAAAGPGTVLTVEVSGAETE